MASVSVIIPTWNRAGTVAAAIGSALCQSDPPLEVLVCDDGSSDHTREVVAAFADPRIRWLPGRHSGLPAVPRNRGIAASKGDWLAFLDSDDEWLPDKLARQLRLAGQLACRAACSNAVRRIPGRGRVGELVTWRDEHLSFDCLLRGNQVICSSAVIQRSLLEVTGGFPVAPQLKAVEDYALWLRVATQTDFAYVAEPLLVYRDDASNSVRAESPDALAQRKSVLDDTMHWLRDGRVPRERAAAYLARTTRHYRRTMWWLCKSRLKRKGLLGIPDAIQCVYEMSAPGARVGRR